MIESSIYDPSSRRPLGQTGLYVSPICMGCAPLGDMPETFEYSVGREKAHQTLQAVFGSEINFLDTAASYGNGESERRIGETLRDIGGLPEGYVLATKADRDLETGEFSGEQMRRSVERSLQLLGLERLQLLYLHDPEHQSYEYIMAPGGPVEALLSLKEEGVIEHLGVAGGPIDLMIRYMETGLFEAAITHNRYTLIEQSAAPLLEVGIERRIAVLNAAPYGGGMLARGPDAYTRYEYREASEDLITRARSIQSACQKYEVPLAAAALQFSLQDERITSTIVGISHPERVEETINLAKLSIPEDLWDELQTLIPSSA